MQAESMQDRWTAIVNAAGRSGRQKEKGRYTFGDGESWNLETT